MSGYEKKYVMQLLMEHDYDPDLYYPLLTIQSLTKGLERLNTEFSVKLLGLENITNRTYDGLLPIFTSGEQTIFSRRVALQLENTSVVVAESLCPATSKFWCDYLNCGQQSLGRKLFNGDLDIQRTEFIYQLANISDLPFDESELQGCKTPIIARQSIFIYQNEPLHLTEWYLSNLDGFKIQKIKNESE